MSRELAITHGFTEAERKDVAALYDAAFGSKIGIAIPDDSKRLMVLAQAFDPSHCFVARHVGDVVGIAGFKTENGALTSAISFKLLHKWLGLLGAVRAAVILTLFERKQRPGELLMDGISVAPSARGCGIGGMLIEHLKQFSTEAGYRSIRLDVIDTNDAARRLYERLGFVATRTSRFAYLRWLLGFSAATTMLYRHDHFGPESLPAN